MTLGIRSPGFYTRAPFTSHGPAIPLSACFPASAGRGKPQRPGLPHTRRPAILLEGRVSVCPSNARVSLNRHHG